MEEAPGFGAVGQTLNPRLRERDRERYRPNCGGARGVEGRSDLRIDIYGSVGYSKASDILLSAQKERDTERERGRHR